MTSPAVWLRWIRVRLAKRPDTEHEQAVVRLVVGALIVLYLVPDALRREATPTLWVMLGYLVVSILVFGHILAAPGVSAARRVFAALADVTTLTWVMAMLGERAAPLILVYVWITLANGFRFGTRYLLVSLVLCAIGLGVVVWQSEFWNAHREAGIGLLFGFVVLSLYVRSLVRKLFDALDKAEAANQAKRRFISVVSHEMRTPLNAIIGMSDLMRDTHLSREQADMVQTVRSASQVMLGLVEEVLDLSKIESGKLTLERTDFDVHALVQSTCRILAAQASAKGIEFVVSIMPEVPPAVRGDPHYLRQVLINLAGNAVKFTERGGVTVHITAQEDTEARVRLKFSVRDSGIGIAPEAQSRIFDSFAQADQTTTRRFGGTGLGTTIAKQLVELMGGRIGLESAVGLGSTFWFEVTLDRQPEQSGGAAGELAGTRVLLVGLPEAQRQELEAALRSWGAQPVAAKSIEAAAARVVAEISLAPPFHSAMLYHEQSGVDLLARFRRASPDPAPPAILVVPQEAAHARFDALSAGFSAVLELPLDKRRLFNVLHSVGAGDELGDGVIRLHEYGRSGQTQRRLHVLVADDNPTNREVAGKILERAGHSVTLVADGEEALDAIETRQIDLVLLDRNMPRLDGLDVLKALGAMTPGERSMPILMLSADVTAEAKQECLEAGASGFLGKPIEAARLLQEVMRAVEGHPVRKTAPPAPPAQQGRPMPAAGAPVPIVNVETLAHLEELGSSPAFVDKLARVFIADNAALLEKIESSVKAFGFKEFRSHLHALKGSSASMGTDRLTRLCAMLGKLSDNEMRLQSVSLVRSLSDELLAARKELERYVAERLRSAG